MKGRWTIVYSILAVLLLALAAGLTQAQGPTPSGGVGVQAALGTAFTYQGQLKKAGNPVNGTCDFQFSLYDAASGGSPIGVQTTTGITVTNGLFTVQLDFGAGAFQGDARWLEIAVKCTGDAGYVTLSQRQPLTPAPYALALPGLWTQQNATSPNLIGGYSGNSVTAGVYGATIGGGGASGSTNRVTDNYGTVGGGRNNQAGNGDAVPTNATNATVGGGHVNTASGYYATVGGGFSNTASGYAATVGGGFSNTASGDHTTVGGGYYNTASNSYATVGGGYGNTASDDYATVGGGRSNTASNSYATVGGGYYNTASADYATIAGGGPSDPDNPSTTNNRVTDNYGTIGGGGNNRAGNGDADPTNATYATIGGGQGNTASAIYATVGGGRNNTASGYYATVDGGWGNNASADYATIAGGGAANTASGYYATVGGGYYNIASSEYATVGGGDSNTASGGDATVGGGRGNTASGWAATVPGGLYAAATHLGEMAYAGGRFAATGDAQTSVYVLRRSSSGTTLTELFLDGSSQRLTIASGRTVTFDILIVGRENDNGESAGYRVLGVIENVGGTTTIVGSVSTTELGKDDASWNVTVDADDTNDALRIRVQGGTGDSVRWVATVRTAEVSW
jgi:hypothetical protein